MPDQMIQVELNQLLLDAENPRLPEAIERGQQALVDYIAETTSIVELMMAMGENGYFPGEPLIVIPDGAGRYIVVEGNRRLTALKLLQDPAFCSNPGKRMRDVAAQAKYKPNSVPVVVRPNRADVLPYLGFRHITGAKAWEPLAKSRYIEQLFNHTDVSLSPRERYGSVARAIGSRRDFIKRNLDALAVYKEIAAHDFYGIDDLNEQSIKFSILSTALADDRIADFIGIVQKDEAGDFIEQDPIVMPACLKKQPIRELIQWLFERDLKGRTRVGESRNLRLLAAVVDNPKALAAFRNNSPLKIAYQMTSDSTLDFVQLLYLAEGSVTEAASMVANVGFSDEGFDTARRILENIKLIGRTLKAKGQADDDF